jgi:hypothetical protein
MWKKRMWIDCRVIVEQRCAAETLGPPLLLKSLARERNWGSSCRIKQTAWSLDSYHEAVDSEQVVIKAVVSWSSPLEENYWLGKETHQAVLLDQERENIQTGTTPDHHATLQKQT